MTLPIIINPRRPESYQLFGLGNALSSQSLQPPVAAPIGRRVGGVETNANGWLFVNQASQIKTLGNVYQNVTIGLNRTLEGPNYAEQSSDSLLVPVDYTTVNGVDYPIYAAARDRVEFVLRLWHDKPLTIPTVFGGQIADIVCIPLNIEIWGFELYVNPNTTPDVTFAELYNVMFH